MTQDELIRQILEVNAQQRQAIDSGIATLQETRTLLQQQNITLEKAQEQVKQVDAERNKWQQYGSDQHEKFMNAEKRVSEQEAAKLKWMGAFIGLALLAAAFIGIKYFSPWGRLIP